jgi:zinc transport system substrate-binding protein
MRQLPLLALTAVLVGTTAVKAEVPDVVVTIKPLHALVASVMGDLGSPTLIVRGGASPHTYSLRPSDAGALEGADIVFWTGHGMELFLEDAFETLAPRATVVELSQTPGINLLPPRAGGAFEAHAHDDDDDHDGHGHDDDDDHDGHDHDGHDRHDDDDDGHEGHGHDAVADMHYWLDPANAVLMVAHIAETLSTADPENAEAYGRNADATTADLEALTADVAAQLAEVRERPFIVFHDAYQYFERRFDLAVAGSVTVNPEVLPGAARINALKQTIADTGAACVFAEPQFEPAIISAIIEDTEARAGTLDPEGATLDEGPGLYRELIETLAAGLTDCLGDR